jgi:hypothetical protein
MQKTIFQGLMALPFNPCIYCLVFPVTANFLLASPSLATAKNFFPSEGARYSSLLGRKITRANSSRSSYLPHENLMQDELASRDEQQPGRECILIGRCKG